MPQYVINNYSGLVKFYNEQNFKLGLNRSCEWPEPIYSRIGTREARKSIAQQDVRKLYSRFVVVMDSILHPEHLGLALETNLIRVSSPSSIYDGVKKAANDVVADVRAVDSDVKLSVSVQADVAWGYAVSTNTYAGIAQDLIDFGFLRELGISSYPYFNLDDPDNFRSIIIPNWWRENYCQCLFRKEDGTHKALPDQMEIPLLEVRHSSEVHHATGAIAGQR